MGTLSVLLALSVLIGALVNRSVAFTALILTKKYHDRRTFYLKSVLRLWPTYLLVLMAAYAWVYAGGLYTGKRRRRSGCPEVFATIPLWEAFLRAANLRRPSGVGLSVQADERPASNATAPYLVRRGIVVPGALVAVGLPTRSIDRAGVWR